MEPKISGQLRARRLASGALAAVIVVTGILVVMAGAGNPPHSVQITVPEATGVIAGERMVQGGLTAGTIETASVTGGGKAHLVMGINSKFWPIPRDSLFVLRMGGTIKYTDRYIEIERGHSSAMLTQGSVLPATRLITPVEYDSIFNLFDARTRAGLKRTLDNAGPTFAQAAPSFRRALEDASPALGQADTVFRDVDSDQQALSMLLSSSAEVSDAVARSNPSLQSMLTSLASTFSAAAGQSTALQHAIAAAPASLSAVTAAANHVSTTLPLVATLTHGLDPSVAQLEQLSGPLNATLREIVQVAPPAVSALNTITSAGPELTELTTVARTTLMPRLGSISKQAAKQLDCIRPYTPEAMSTIQEFVNGLQADGPANPRIHVLHALITAMPFPNDMPISFPQLTKLFPKMGMNYPGVPGLSLNQPWFQPQCKVTPAALDPNTDSEAHMFDPAGSKVIPFN